MGNATTNLSDLVNAAPLELNITGLNSTVGAINAIQDTTANNLGNVWFLVSIVVIFGMLIWVFMGREKNILLDISRAILTSSVWCLLISATFLLGGLMTSILPLLWFSSTTVIAVGAVHKLKTKGL